MPAALQIENIKKIFKNSRDTTVAVDGVSLDIAENEFITLLGPSGCGKTTLLRLVAGLETADSGKIILGGLDITEVPAHLRPVNTVFQNYALFPHMSVAENISFGLAMRGTTSKEKRADIIRDILRTVDLQGFESRMPSQLSGGQQQRVALARALVNRPKVLLLDESLSALDAKLRQHMQLELKRLQRETGITFIFVTHDQEEAMSMSDRIAVMDKGKIVQTGSPRDIYEAPANAFVATFIGACNFVKARSLGLNQDGNIGFRPENAALEAHPQQKQLTATGRITDMRYQGASVDYHLQLASNENIVVRGGPHGGFAPGQSVSVTIDPARVIRCTP